MDTFTAILITLGSLMITIIILAVIGWKDVPGIVIVLLWFGIGIGITLLFDSKRRK